MNDVFRPFIDDFAIVYLDDILIFSPLEEHVKHVKQVFDVLVREKLYLKMSKCGFGKTSLVYIGYILGGGELNIDPCKVESIVNNPNPNNVTYIGRFLGASQYWRKFIVNCSFIYSPIHALKILKKSLLVRRKGTKILQHTKRKDQHHSSTCTVISTTII